MFTLCFWWGYSYRASQPHFGHTPAIIAFENCASAYVGHGGQLVGWATAGITVLYRRSSSAKGLHSIQRAILLK